jgi:nucleotide-binding universal stress UspA family protein
LFTNILVAIDGSPNSYRGLEMAIDIAQKYEAKITLIHVVQRPTYWYASEGPILVDDDQESRELEEAKNLLLKRSEELKQKNVRLETLLVEGHPAEEILKASNGCDLIVIGSRGLGRFESLLLGSVASSVVSHAKKPVLVVRPE